MKNPVLFKDSLILVITPWSKPYYLKLEDEDPLKKIGENAYVKTCMKIVAAERHILNSIAAAHRALHGKGANIAAAASHAVAGLTKSNSDIRDQTILPAYCRNCLSLTLSPDSLASKVRTHLRPLL
jgi:hypothetical protein